MDNNLFRALSSKTRIEIMKRVMGREYHLSHLARELGISKSVVSRHIRILEKANLIKRKKIGNIHLLIANPEVLEKAFEPFVEETKIEARRGETISDILKQFPEIKTKEYKG
ncbi:MAG TPA: ArsR family transcriptional regulator, partial [Thermoplasmatales archaeon]|nr:ArsR family transcriptional regulator [Thermoplasmatales archaeon]